MSPNFFITIGYSSHVIELLKKNVKREGSYKVSIIES